MEFDFFSDRSIGKADISANDCVCLFLSFFFFYLEALRASQTRSCCLKCKSVIYFTHTFYQVQFFLIDTFSHILLFNILKCFSKYCVFTVVKIYN